MLTLSLILGIVVSMAGVELVGLSAGGMVTPGYLALLLDQPAALGGMLALAFATFGMIRLIGRHLMLYGVRRFSLTVLFGMFLAIGLSLVPVAIGPIFIEWAGIGYIVPGLIAHQFDRQGLLPTLVMIVLASIVTRLAGVLILYFQP